MHNQKITVIGDVHGKIDSYLDICQRENEAGYDTICVGDVGFQKDHNILLEKLNHQKNKVNFGNHDYWPRVAIAPYSLGRFSFNRGILTFAGAFSIDKQYRTPGLDWFPEEQTNFAEFGRFVTDFHYKPVHTVISHEAPQTVVRELWGYSSDMTREMLDVILKLYKPSRWFFGHHHQSRSIELSGCKFRCLAELEEYRID